MAIFVTISFDVKGAIDDTKDTPWYLQCPITKEDVDEFNKFRDSIYCDCKEDLGTFAQDMMTIQQVIARKKGTWNEKLMKLLIENSSIPLIVQAVIGVTPLTEEKPSEYLIAASQCLPILTKATRILAYYLHQTQGKNLCAGSWFILEGQGKELWFTYAKTNYGYLPLFWKIWKDGRGEKHIFSGSVYWKNGGKVTLKRHTRTMTDAFSFVFDVSSKSLVEDRGVIVSLFSNLFATKPSWGEVFSAFHGIHELTPFEYFPEILIADGKARDLLGDDYPKPPSVGIKSKKDIDDSSKEFFIPLPSMPEEYADVYDAVVRGLVEDYYATEIKAEKGSILRALCIMGESSLLLENIPAEKPEVRPEGLTDPEWRTRQRRLAAKKKSDVSIKEKVDTAIEAAQENLVAERIASAPVSALEDASVSAVASLPDMSTVEEDPFTRERAIQAQIEAQNKAARDARAAERVARQAAWEASHGGKGSGGGTASAVGAGTGAGAGSGSASDASTSVSIDPADQRMKWRHVVNYIKNALKQGGVTAELVKETGSSHFKLHAIDGATGATATDTLFYQHGTRASGGYGSWYQGIVERILGNLGKAPVVRGPSGRK